MDWDHAIKRNSEVLAGIVESLFIMLGLVGEATVSRLPWPTYRAVLRVLRPAKSCLRRLIVVAARGLVLAPAVSRPRRAGAAKPRKGGTPRVPCLPALRPATPHRVPAPEKASAGCPPHPLFQYRWRVCDHWVAAAAGKGSRPAQIPGWPGQRGAGDPPARGPRCRPGRPSPPGQTPRPLADA